METLACRINKLRTTAAVELNNSKIVIGLDDFSVQSSIISISPGTCHFFQSSFCL